MTDAPFDPTGAVTFDLASGRVSMKNSPPRVLVPSEQLNALCDAAGEDATRSLGRAMGESMGQRAVASLVSEQQPTAAEASIERFIEHLAGEFALVGLGVLGAERWGHAMLLTIDPAVGNDGLIRAILASALQCATSQEVGCVKVAETAGVHRYLMTSPESAARVQRELGEGKVWGEVLVQLHGGAGAAQSGGDA